MKELSSSMNCSHSQRRRAYFIDSKSISIGAKRFNDDFYFFDLTHKHSQEPLGFNHPLLLRQSHYPKNHCYSQSVDHFLDEIRETLNNVLSIKLSFSLVDQNSLNRDLNRSMVVDHNFFKHPRHFKNLKKNIDDIEDFYFFISSSFYLVGSRKLKTSLELSNETLRKISPDIDLLKRKVKFYFESNLLLDDGKLTDLNLRILNFSKDFSRVEAKDLSLVLHSEDENLAADKHEQLKERGLVVDQREKSLHLSFPLTILDDEFDEIIGILREHLA